MQIQYLFLVFPEIKLPQSQMATSNRGNNRYKKFLHCIAKVQSSFGETDKRKKSAEISTDPSCKKCTDSNIDPFGKRSLNSFFIGLK